VSFTVLLLVIHLIYGYRVQIYFDEYVNNQKTVESIEIDMIAEILNDEMRDWIMVTNTIAESQAVASYLHEETIESGRWVQGMLEDFTTNMDSKFLMQFVDSEGNIKIKLDNALDRGDDGEKVTNDVAGVCDVDIVKEHLSLYNIKTTNGLSPKICISAPVKKNGAFLGNLLVSYYADNVISIFDIVKHKQSLEHSLIDTTGGWISLRGEKVTAGHYENNGSEKAYIGDVMESSELSEGQWFNELGLLTFKRFNSLEKYLGQDFERNSTGADGAWTVVSFVPSGEFDIQREVLWSSILKLNMVLIPVVTMVSFFIAHFANKSKRYKDTIECYAIQDHLTGIYNRRAGMEFLDQQIKLSKRYNESFTVGFIDINDLKYVNDNFGHLEGDFLIQKICRTIEDNKRDSDILTRVGGDEFVIIFTKCTPDLAEAMIKRTVQDLDEFNKLAVKPYKISMSYGFHEYTAESDYTINEMIAEAERKMYEHKSEYKAANGIKSR